MSSASIRVMIVEGPSRLAAGLTAYLNSESDVEEIAERMSRRRHVLEVR